MSFFSLVIIHFLEMLSLKSEFECLIFQNENIDNTELTENIITVRNNCATITASSSGPHTTISLIKPASPSYISVSQTNTTNDRPPVLAHNSLYGKSVDAYGNLCFLYPLSLLLYN